MKTLARKHRKVGKSRRIPVQQKVLAIDGDDYRKLTDKQRKRFDNPAGHHRLCEWVDGELRWSHPYDFILGPISRAVGETIVHDIFEPDERPLEIETVVNGEMKTLVRQRTDYECGTAQFGLCLPSLYFDCRNDAFENAAKALEGLAKLLTNAAARVRKLNAKKGGAA